MGWSTPLGDAVMSDEAPRDLIFYDGTCGLCRGWLRFLLRGDRDGTRFRYAPLQGKTWLARVAAERRDELPDRDRKSVV